MQARIASIAAALVLVLVVAPAAAHAAGPPQLSADGAILIDAKDGHVIYASNGETRSPIASTTKLMTALLALEKLPLDKELAAADYKPSSPDESLANLRPGERMKVDDLLRALLLESANDAAVTLARGAGGSQQKFVRMMNRRARQLGLRNTHYENPIGLDSDKNFSSAHDLTRLTRVLEKNAFFNETVKMSSARLLSGAFPRTIENRNNLVGRYPWITGVKTGHTSKAGYVLVGSGTKKGAKLVSVVLHEPSSAARDADTVALLDYGFSLYTQRTPVRAGATVSTAKIKYFGDDKAKLTGARTVRVPVRRGQRLRTVIDGPTQLEGPIEKGTRVGTIRVIVGGKRVATVALVTAGDVPEASIFRKFAYYVFRPWLLIAIAIVVAALVIRSRRRRRAAEQARRRRRRAAKLE